MLDTEFFKEITEGKAKLLSHIERMTKVMTAVPRQETVKQFIAAMKCLGRHREDMEIDQQIEHMAAQFVLEAILHHGWEESAARGEYLVKRVNGHVAGMEKQFEELRKDPLFFLLRELFR